ncbi:hypothetical protein [Glycomyces sp. NPDC047010]|uniref:hypothetical protein n=1 Tax=Glycomyces sp. NPDC047010 TaxID=3155023 RepID=UPI003409696B
MRLTRLIGPAAALALAGSALATGTAAQAETPAPDTGAPASVTLPTGDRVTVLPGGATGIEPAPGREDTTFLTPPSPDGDIVVVPADRVAAVLGGDEDPRRYNVTELLAAGQSDAAAAPAAALDDSEYTGLVPAADGAAAFADGDLQPLHLTLLDRDGKAPDGSWMLWVARDGSAAGDIPIGADGTGTIDLPPGDYIVVSGFWSAPTGTGRGQQIAGITPVAVGDGPAELVLDGAAAAPVGVHVERETEFLNAAFNIGAKGPENLGYGVFLGPLDDAFVLPEPDLPEYELSFVYQPVLTGPVTDPVPYAYNLAFVEKGAYPEDTEFTVADEDLAAVATDYRDLGTAYSAKQGDTCDYGDHVDGWLGSGFCSLVPTAVPSQRTMLYTADPDVQWNLNLKAGTSTPDGVFLTDGFAVGAAAVLEPGRSERTMPRGGLSAGLSGAYRHSDGGVDYMGFDLAPNGGGNGEQLVLAGDKGDVTLSRDGEVLSSVYGLDFYLERMYGPLPESDAGGRYTLSVDATETSKSRVFGTDFATEWSFDSAEAAEGEWSDIALPVVQLTSDAIEGGYAPKRGCQEITLDLRTNQYLPAVHAEDMAFEVSYDDGATWRDVPLDRDGDTATAELTHPRRAEWVSVRLTALDDHGTEVTQTVIRAFGLD